MRRGVRWRQAGRGDNSPRTCRRVRGAAMWLATCALVAFIPLPAAAQDAIVGPVAEDSADPVLAFAREASDLEELRAAVLSAIERSGSLGEARAARDEAEARRNEVRTQETPTLELGLSSFRVISRDFSNDPQNFLERSRPSKRTDATLRASQLLFDFGATVQRIEAANARIEVAIAQIDDTANQTALRTVSVQSDVHGRRTLVQLGSAFVASLYDLRAKMVERVDEGVSSEVDLAQVDGYIAQAEAQQADFERGLAAAEAAYFELVGTPAPPGLGRPPVPFVLAGSVTAEGGQTAALLDTLPQVRAASAGLRAAEREAKAARADILPKVTLSVDAGRYDIIESTRDYDIRATVNLNFRLFGGEKQRADQAEARQAGAQARLDRLRDEALRNARIAATDVAALEKAEAAVRMSYLSSRRAKGAVFERFQVARAALLDVLVAESNYFDVATRYLQTVTELDVARYVFLARTGSLQDALGIDSAMIADTP